MEDPNSSPDGGDRSSMTDLTSTPPAEVEDPKPTEAMPSATDLPVTAQLEDGRVAIEVRHSPEAGCAAFGTQSIDFMQGQVGSLAVAFQNSRKIGDKGQLNTALAFVQSMKPRDETETLLLSQMAAINAAMLRTYRVFESATVVEQFDSASNALNKLSRTFTAQVEALKRYRTGGEQRVTVQHQHVNVEDGGQAVVGSILTGGGGAARKGGATS